MGRRVIGPARAEVARRAEGAEGDVLAQASLDQYWERLLKLIPAEVTSLYVAGKGVIPAEQKMGLIGWALFCLIATVIYMAWRTRDQVANQGPAWRHVGISTVSYVVWVYVLGGPFAAYGLYTGWLATLIMLGWTFLVPLIYQGE